MNASKRIGKLEREGERETGERYRVEERGFREGGNEFGLSFILIRVGNGYGLGDEYKRSLGRVKY